MPQVDWMPRQRRRRRLLRTECVRDDAFVVVEFSQCAYELFRRRIRSWEMADIQALLTTSGIDRAEWERRRQQPECSYYRWTLRCEEATCGRQEDTAMIRGRIEEAPHAGAATEAAWDWANESAAGCGSRRAEWRALSVDWWSSASQGSRTELLPP